MPLFGFREYLRVHLPPFQGEKPSLPSPFPTLPSLGSHDVALAPPPVRRKLTPRALVARAQLLAENFRPSRGLDGFIQIKMLPVVAAASPELIPGKFVILKSLSVPPRSMMDDILIVTKAKIYSLVEWRKTCLICICSKR